MQEAQLNLGIYRYFRWPIKEYKPRSGVGGNAAGQRLTKNKIEK